MTILYKLVGVTNTRSTCTELSHENWDESKTTFSIKDAITYFDSLGLDKERASEVKFITNAEIMSEEKTYDLSKGNLSIYVFSQSEEIKSIIFKIFQDNGKVSTVQQTNNEPEQKQQIIDPSISKPLAEDLIKITPEIIEESNKTTVELFGNKNFQTLMKIFYEDPDVFKIFASYVVSGDMIENPFSETVESEFDEEVQHIVSLGIPISEEKIRQALKKFNGHINLTLRYLLTINSLV